MKPARGWVRIYCRGKRTFAYWDRRAERRRCLACGSEVRVVE